MSSRSKRGSAKRKMAARSDNAQAQEQRRLRQRAERFRVLREQFEDRHSWNLFRSWTRVRVRWQWVLLTCLVICVFCWVLGLHVFGHISLAMAIEQVLHKLGERTVAFVEDM